MVKREIANCKPYQAPAHFDCSTFRIVGKDETGASKYWVGMSHFLPGGGCEMGGTDHDRFYYVIEGQLTVYDDKGNKYVLNPTDSIFMLPGEQRRVANETNFPVTTLVVYNY
jgi:quercetin dioxygenase-like cupin family protein